MTRLTYSICRTEPSPTFQVWNVGLAFGPRNRPLSAEPDSAFRTRMFHRHDASPGKLRCLATQREARHSECPLAPITRVSCFTLGDFFLRVDTVRIRIFARWRRARGRSSAEIRQHARPVARGQIPIVSAVCIANSTIRQMADYSEVNAGRTQLIRLRKSNYQPGQFPRARFHSLPGLILVPGGTI
jgi:hypothetical protein